MQKPLPRIGLIGCGTIGRRHAQNLKDRARLYYSSRSPASAEAFQQTFGGAVCATWEALVDLPEIDAVVICSPPRFHRPQILAALTGGKAVLVEKPMCTRPEEVIAVEQALAVLANPLFMVAENYYYKPSLKITREALAAGHLGAIQTAYIRKCFTQPSSGWKSEYGALLEGGIHFVALISDLFDRPPARVQAQFPGAQPGRPERHVKLQLDYGEARATLEYAWDVPSRTKGLFQHSHITGDAGRIFFESNGLYLRLRAPRHSRWHFPLKDLMGYGAMTDDFLACLADRQQQPYSDFTRAKRDLQIVFDAYAQLP